MEVEFFKYQGTGNDFVIVDDRAQNFPQTDVSLIRRLCDRRFGIGADGFILLQNHDSTDFKMVYFNADGNESSMCGNGGRCIMAFAKYLGLIDDEATFMAIDGLHRAKVKQGVVELQMMDVMGVKELDGHYFLDTGSPHVVLDKDDLEHLNVLESGRVIRNSPAYIAKGTNVNFIKQIDEDTFAVRTYERGVEAETLSCGTGVTAVALAAHYSGKTEHNKIDLNTNGGKLSVSFRSNGKSYTDIWLIGPVQQVFKGRVAI